MDSSFVPLFRQSIQNKNIDALLKLVNSKLDIPNPTEQDFANLKRRKSRFELVLLSLIVFGIEICYAAETAFVSPILQKIGVPVQYMTMVWGLSPLVGFFACPVLGSLSDGCRSRLGRRRPFIIIYSCGIMLGLLLTGFGQDLGQMLDNANNTNNTRHFAPHPFVIFITIIGIMLLDFDCDACQSPARAYLIDVSTQEDHSVGLSTFTIMAGAGGSLGYALGYVPWGELVNSRPDEYTSVMAQQKNYTNISELIYINNFSANHKQVLFLTVAVIYVICAVISISSFKEIPLGSTFMKSSSCTFKYGRMEEDPSVDDFGSYQNETRATASAARRRSVQSLDREQQQQPTNLEILKYYLTSIVKMPVSLRWLCLTHCLCWMSLLCYSLYFTDFIGQEVFGGDPEPTNLHLHMIYERGVRVGSLCMALYSIACSFYSFFLQVLMTNFRTRNVYMFSTIVYSCGMFLLAVSKSKLIAPLTSLTAGVMYSSLFTIPFILVANYHSTETFELIETRGVGDPSTSAAATGESVTAEKIKRGLGTDLSLVSSMVFIAQFLLSFFMGPLIKLFATKAVIMYSASFFSACACYTSTRLLYLD